MSVSWTLLVFSGSFALAILSSLVLGADLDRIGRRLHLSEGLIGLLTALGADGPEICSAIIALRAGYHDVGVGVILGSNIFNLAALLGLCAIVVGHLRVGRHGLILDGVVGILLTLLASALIFRLVAPGVVAILMAIVFIPYVTAYVIRPELAARLPLPAAVHRFLDRAVVNVHQDARKDQTPPQAHWMEFISVMPAAASIILGSFGMVNSAVQLGVRWHVSQAVVGTLVLAALTSLPNAATALRLALHGRGAAVVSETLNSNTLNLAAGLCLPALFVPVAVSPSYIDGLSIWWLLAMTVVAIAATYRRHGLGRLGGTVIVLMYAIFTCLAIRHS